MIDFLKSRAVENTTRTALSLALTAVATPIMAGASFHTCLMVAFGATLPAIGAALTPDKGPSQ